MQKEWRHSDIVWGQRRYPLQREHVRWGFTGPRGNSTKPLDTNGIAISGAELVELEAELLIVCVGVALVGLSSERSLLDAL